MKQAKQIIEGRLSCRTFSSEPLSREHEELVESLTSGISHGPLGSAVNVTLIENTPRINGELAERATYGSVTGAPALLVPVVERSRHAMEDLGAVLQRIVLTLEGAGVAACWFAGNFSEGLICEKVGGGRGDLIPAVVALGYRAYRRTTSEGPTRFSVGSRKRRKWSELFMELEFWDDERRPHSPPVPLTPAEAPDYEDMLEAVRLAPSTSNNQPWRIFRYSEDNGPDRLHLCIKRNAGVDKLIKDIDIQKVDAGVAMTHFSVVAEQIGISGSWVYERPHYLPPGVEYIATWLD